MSRHAVLAVLAERPGYSYQLRDRIEHRMGPAWAVESGQVTNAVTTLLRDGLIRRIDHAGVGAPDNRKVYAITETGLATLEELFDGEAALRLPRRTLLTQITFARPERLGDAMDKLDQYERECAGRLDQIMRAYREMPADGPRLRADHLLLRLNLSADLAYLEAELRWLVGARQMISWLSSRDAIWPGMPTAEERTPEELAREELLANLARPERGAERAEQ